MKAVTYPLKPHGHKCRSTNTPTHPSHHVEDRAYKSQMIEHTVQIVAHNPCDQIMSYRSSMELLDILRVLLANTKKQQEMEDP
jgi:hypothetical protein